jgi:hypothetical protein
MNLPLREMATSAQALGEMAQTLKELAARFSLSAAAPAEVTTPKSARSARVVAAGPAHKDTVQVAGRRAADKR